MDGKYDVKRAKHPVDWTVEVPGSKSITNRALLMAALSRGCARLTGALFSEDSRYFLRSLQTLGFQAEADEEKRTMEVTGLGGRIPRGEGEIYVGSAGTAARFLTAMLGLSGGCYAVGASEQMKRRPMRPLFEALTSLGAGIQYPEREGHLPARVRGAAAVLAAQDGPAAPDLDTSDSTQFLSAMLLVSPMFPRGADIRVTGGRKDGSYIRITRNMMEQFGVRVMFDGESYHIPADAAYRREQYAIEPDMSAACYFYGAAAVTGGTVLVKGIHADCMQGDLRFLDVLREMGCSVKDEDAGIRVSGPPAGCLKGVSVDMNDFSDQALTLAAIAPYADSDVTISHVAHIRAQESDRIRAITENLARAGIACEEFPDGVRIHPGKPRPCSIATFEDHRAAMAFSLLGLGCDGIAIENPSCCAKTFENYFEVLDRLNGSCC